MMAQLSRFIEACLMPKSIHTYYYELPDVHCGSCTFNIEEIFKDHPDKIASINANPATKTAIVNAFCPIEELDPIITEVKDSGQRMIRANDPLSVKTNSPQKYWKRFWVASLLGIPLMIIDLLGVLPGPTQTIGLTIHIVIALVTLGVMIYSGGEYFKLAFSHLKNPDMNTLLTLGTLSAWIFSILMIAVPTLIPGGSHLFLCASVMILAIVNLGRALKEEASNKIAKEVAQVGEVFHDLQPDKVEILNESYVITQASDLTDDDYKTVDYRTIQKGDRILVRAGKRFPIDGTIITEAIISTDEECLTGDANPVTKRQASKVFAGTLYLPQVEGTQEVIIQANCDGASSTLNKLRHHIAAAQNTKTFTVSLAQKASRYFSIIIIAIAFISALLWLLLGPAPMLGYAITVFLSVLLCACPCALALAPYSGTVAINEAFKNGILIHNAQVLENLPQVNTWIFDKTGTLTTGEMTLNQIMGEDEAYTQDQLLQWAASAEKDSQHSIAKALVAEAKKKNLPLLKSSTVGKFSPNEICKQIKDGPLIQLGNEQYFNKDPAITIPHQLKFQADQMAMQGKTPTFLAVDGKCIAIIITEETLRPDAIDTIRALSLNSRIIMLTGSNELTAKSIADRFENEDYIKIIEVQYGKSPIEKAEFIESIRQKKDGSIIGMVGDGINDMPALKKADVAVAIGAWTHAASVANLSFKNPELGSIIKAINLARSTRNNLIQNLSWAFIYNFISILLATGVFFPAFGVLLNPIMASAIMGFSSIFVLLNAMRLSYQIEKQFNPKLTFWKKIQLSWKQKSLAQKIISISLMSLCTFSILLATTLVFNFASGFPPSVIFNSMILSCTCCTGIVGILSAVGLFGLLASLIIVVAIKKAFRSNQSSPTSKSDTPSNEGSPTRRSLGDLASKPSEESKPSFGSGCLKFFAPTRATRTTYQSHSFVIPNKRRC